MPIVKRASEAAKARYGRTDPLYGFVNIDGTSCAIEYLAGGHGQPNYEILAPPGFAVSPNGARSFVCVTLDDVKKRSSRARLIPTMSTHA